MSTCLQFFTQDSTLLGMTFQNWKPVVTGIFIVWVSALISKTIRGRIHRFFS
jgi:hypothetical protein